MTAPWTGPWFVWDLDGVRANGSALGLLRAQNRQWDWWSVEGPQEEDQYTVCHAVSARPPTVQAVLDHLRRCSCGMPLGAFGSVDRVPNAGTLVLQPRVIDPGVVCGDLAVGDEPLDAFHALMRPHAPWEVQALALWASRRIA